MKRIYLILLSIISIISLSSCRQTENKNTIEKLPLSKDEQQIANLTSDILEKFLFEKDRMYDINIYLYKDSSIENIGGVIGIDTKGEAGIVLVSGRKDGNVSFSWNISNSDVVVKSPAVEINDDKTFMRVNGVGQEKFIMEEGKEYVLIFVAYKEGNEILTSSTELFYIWDTIEDKTTALAIFDYAYTITVRFSDSPVKGFGRQYLFKLSETL